jgi:hypothetical protein
MTPAERQRRFRAGLTEPPKPSYQALQQRLQAAEARSDPVLQKKLRRRIHTAVADAVESIRGMGDMLGSLEQENQALEAERDKLAARVAQLEGQRLARKIKKTVTKVTI